MAAFCNIKLGSMWINFLVHLPGRRTMSSAAAAASILIEPGPAVRGMVASLVKL